MGWNMSTNGHLRPDPSEMAVVKEHAGVRLESWKEIASYLMRSERTVRRWEETEELPIHRQLHEKRGSVYAYSAELDVWRESRRLLEPDRSDPLEQNLPNGDQARDKPDVTGSESNDLVPSAVQIRSGGFVSKLGPWSLLAFLGAVFAIYVIRQIPRRANATLTVVPFTTTPGNEVQPSLSPDGTKVVFAYNQGDPSGYHLFVKAIGSDELVRLTSDGTNDRSPSWSPDGQSIAFLRFNSDQSAQVMVIPSSGGADRQLAKLLVYRSESEIRVAWSPDNKWIATSDSETPTSAMSLVLISAITGEKRRLVYKPATVEADLSPSFSPDGRYLAFARHLGPHSADIYLLELPQRGLVAGEARRLTTWNRMAGNPIWTGDGQDVIFVGDHSQLGFQIWKFPALHAGDPVSFNEIGQDSASIALSPLRNRLVYERKVEDTNIWHIDFDSPLSTPGNRRVVSKGPLIASTRQDFNPQYSPDGRHVAYQSDRSGYCEIWIAGRDGTSPRQLTSLHAEISGFPTWSPDGKLIAFHSRLNGYANLFVANVETGDYRKLTTGTTNDTAPRWSHDGKWIYFESEREDGPQIWRISAAGGPATQLTRAGGVVALESVDGRLLFYSKDSEPGLWVLPLKGGTESQVLPSLYGVDNFAVTKQGIYFIRRAPDVGAVIGFMSFSSRMPVDLASIKFPVGMGLAVSPDERSILYTQLDRADSDLFLVDNFK